MKQINAKPRTVVNCPACGLDVTFRPVDDKLLAYGLDDKLHTCEGEPERKQIGQALLQRKVEEFQLRDRRVTIRLSGGYVFEVHADSKPLRLRLITPTGILEE